MSSAAAEALGMIGDTTAVPALLQALRSDEWHVRNRGTEALVSIIDYMDLGVVEKSIHSTLWLLDEPKSSIYPLLFNRLIERLTIFQAETTAIGKLKWP